MYQFFVEEAQISEKEIRIEGSDVNHMKNVLRMKFGEKIRISSDTGRNFYGAVSELTDEFVLVTILEELEENTELPNKIYLFQGLPKSDKMELIIQKAVELGVYEIIPVSMKNCVAKLEEKKVTSKIARWQEIAKSAAKQSKRSLVPKVQMPMSYKLAIEKAKELDLFFVPYENERGMQATRDALSQIQKGESIGIFIGPEGGFEESEIETIESIGGKSVSLGPRILRTETASLVASSIVLYELSDLGGDE